MLEQKNSLKSPRREFLFSIPQLLLGTGLILPSLLYCTGKKFHVLKGELTPDELEWVKKSRMAKDLEKYFGKGYSCSESILILALRYIKMSEKLVWAAGGFGGGLGQKDLCGYLTGGVMGIGFVSGTLNVKRKVAKQYCTEATKKYWTWWKATAPLHCAEIRKPKSSKKICVRLGQLSAAKLEELIKSLRTSL